PSVPGRLDDRGTEYWYRTRGDRFKPLPEDVAAKMWQEVAQKWDAFGKSLDFNNNTVRKTSPMAVTTHRRSRPLPPLVAALRRYSKPRSSPYNGDGV
ncbi:hypothetical protein FS749_014614, partial [Ceratobasidium sp. UAMH 11750]